MQSSRVDIGRGNGEAEGHLALYADRALDRVGRLQVFGHRSYGLPILGKPRGFQLRDGWNCGVEGRVAYDELFLVDAVKAIGLERQALCEPVVKDAEAATHNSLRTARSARARRPGEGEARREVEIAINVRLVLVAQAQAQGQIRACAPVILKEEAVVGLRNVRFRVASGDG